jgi:type III secretion protein J
MCYDGTAMRVSAALPLVLALAATGCAVPVAAALDEPDANRVVVALDQAGIDATKEIDPQAEGKFRVTVPRDDAARALTTMRDEELPRAKSRGLLDAADRGQLVPSQAAEHAQLVAGLAGELERTLGGVDGVLTARVHLNLPPREPLRDGPPAKASASVLLEHRGTTPPLAPESIQRLVAGGAPGLVPSDIAVVFVPRAARPSQARADLAHVGPITVARGSMTTLKLALAGLVAAILALAAASLALYARLVRVQRARDARPMPGASAGPMRGPAASLRHPSAPPPPS